MRIKDRFIAAFDSIFLGLAMVWAIAIGIALVQPVRSEPAGVVEIHSLAAADSRPVA